MIEIKTEQIALTPEQAESIKALFISPGFRLLLDIMESRLRELTIEAAQQLITSGEFPNRTVLSESLYVQARQIQVAMDILQQLSDPENQHLSKVI